MANANATNEYNVTVPPTFLELTKTYHGCAIVAQNGNIVGRIQSYTPNFAARTITPLYELNFLTFGRPIDNVPGIEAGRSIDIERVEVWGSEMERAFGHEADDIGQQWQDLCDQTLPFILQEAWFKGPTRYLTWEYLGCWFTSNSNGSFAATGEGHVISTANLQYIIRRVV